MQRFSYNPDLLELKVQNVQFLNDVKNTRIERLTISMDSDAVDETLVNDLSTIISDNPGPTQVFFQIRDLETNSFVSLRSKDKTVDVSKALVNYIESHPQMQFHIN